MIKLTIPRQDNVCFAFWCMPCFLHLFLTQLHVFRTNVILNSLHGHLVVNSADYGELIGWSHQLNNPYMKASISNVYQTMVMLDDEETEVVQSKERWAYVKVNMEGIVIGRKICIHEHAGFTSLAIQLEDMFGRHSMFGLRLFDTESEFSLFYKDSTESWRTVGDVPWKEFVERVTRLRITRKDGVFFPPSVSSLFT
ncbi:hypothetical protein C5167_023145 [Papaver somniferum]|uniref:Auxin-responsive protein n=1 Tax=Papaver somniferum TaxID=3469 RepID=A0A4Y7JNZ2_PAPSO|nr:hypothetical protein C5167_023145 [Papaver somniferum]